MRFKSLAALAILASCEAAPVFAQSLPILTRATGPEVTDSALFLISIASPFRTRAVTGALLKSYFVPAVVDSATGAARAQILTTARTLWGQSFNGSANVTAAPTFGAGATVSNGQTLALGTSTVSGTPTWSSVQVFAATQRVDSSTGAARASGLVGSPAITVSSCTGCATPQDSIRLKNGAAATPSLMLANSLTTGLYRFGADTLGISTGGNASLRISGGVAPVIAGGSSGLKLVAGTAGSTDRSVDLAGMNAAGNERIGLMVWADSTRIFNNNAVALSVKGGSTPIWTGGAGSLTVLAGTGNSRAMTLQTTTSAGVVKNTLILGADTSLTTLTDARVFFGGTNAAITGSQTNATFDVLIQGNSMIRATNSSVLLGNGAAVGSLDWVTVPANKNQILRMRADTATIEAKAGVAGGVIRFDANSGSPLLVGGAGNMTIQAGTGNSRTLSLATTTSAGTAKNVVVLGADSSVNFLGNIKRDDGNIYWLLGTSSGSGSLQLRDAAAGLLSSFRMGGDSNFVGIGTGSNQRFQWHMGTGTLRLNDSLLVSSTATGSSGTAVIRGGAGAMAIIAGTGANRTLTLQSSNNSSVATSFLVGNGDTLTLAGHAKGAGNLTAASGTPGTICYVTANGEITKNAATSCVVSSVRFKDNVWPLALDSAYAIVNRLTPVTYTMKDGGRPSLHVIAEQADSISKRLSFYDAQGRVNSVDDGAILSALLRVVQDQQRQLDSLKLALRRR